MYSLIKKIYSVLEKKVSQVNIINLSAGGLRLRTNEIEGKQEILKIGFEINRYKISIIGKVIRLYNWEGIKEVIIQFVKLTLKDKNIINKYVYRYFSDYVWVD